MIQRVLCGAPPGTRTLGPLIKRNQKAFFVQPGIQRKSGIFIQSPLFYLFIFIAFFAPCARLCIQYPAVRCAENVQKCAEGKSVPFHSVPAGIKTNIPALPSHRCGQGAGFCLSFRRGHRTLPPSTKWYPISCVLLTGSPRNILSTVSAQTQASVSKSKRMEVSGGVSTSLVS